jgi:hypothetical protein
MQISLHKRHLEWQPVLRFDGTYCIGIEASRWSIPARILPTKNMILPEYLETVFYGPAPGTGWPSDFHILTAYNPKQILPEPENHAADTHLRLQLEKEQIVHLRITGCSADLLHQEASWALLGISLARAVELGRQYVQHALFEVRNGEAFVVCCDTLERRSLGQFQERCRPR